MQLFYNKQLTPCSQAIIPIVMKTLYYLDIRMACMLVLVLNHLPKDRRKLLNSLRILVLEYLKVLEKLSSTFYLKILETFL